MKNIDIIKSKAISAVKTDGRLIADVAAEFGISRRKLYQWLTTQSKSIKGKTKKQVVGQDVSVLKAQLKILHTEVEHLKSELDQYQITESLENGKLVLSFEQLSPANSELKKVS